MARGFSGIKERSEQNRQRSSRQFDRQFEGPPPLYFSIKEGQSAVVRFLEQDEEVHYADMHEIPVEGRQWGAFVPCLDQKAEGKPCPGCERGLDRKFKGYINVIWFDAPVWKRDENGRLEKDYSGNKISVGHKDQVAIWTSGIRLFEKLEVVNSKYKGLRSRKFEIIRKGEGRNTTYEIQPEDPDSGPQKFSSEEEELAMDKPDLAVYTTPGTPEEFLARLGSSNGEGSITPPKNVFLQD